MVKIAPSILAADFANLAADVARVAADVELLHVDCMDGHYVPNLTIGPPVVAALRPHTELFLDCHLMVDNPGRLLQAFADAGADGLTVHVELGDTASLLHEIADARPAPRSRAGARDPLRRGRALPRRDRPAARDERAHRLRWSAVHSRGAREGARRARKEIDARGASRSRSRSTAASRPPTPAGRRSRRRHPRVGHRHLRRRRSRGGGPRDPRRRPRERRAPRC